MSAIRSGADLDAGRTGDVRERTDIRLALAALAAWLAAVSSLARAPGDVLRTAVVIGVITLAALVLSMIGTRSPAGPVPRWAGPLRMMALAGCGAVLVLVPLAGRTMVAQRTPVHRLAAGGATATVRLVVGADPRPLRSHGAGPPRVLVAGRTSAVLRAGRWITSSTAIVVIAPAPGWASVLPGQPLTAEGGLAPSGDDASSVVLFARDPPVLTGRPPWWQRLAGRVRADLRRACSGLPPDERGLLPGLVVGDTSGLDPVLAEQFRRAGMTHLVAVSGTNCSIVVGVVLLALRRTRARRWVRAGVAGAVLLAFVVVARPSPSVLRAAFMAALTLTALVSGRPRRALPALAAAVLVLLVWQPGLARDFGFAMSVAATAALILIAPGWADWLRTRRVPPVIAEGLAVAAAAHLVTAPLVAWMSGRVSLVAIPANALAEALVAPTTVLGFAAAVVAPVCLPLAAALTWTAGWPCRGLVAVAARFGSLDSGVLAWPSGIGGALLLVAIGAVVVGACRHRVGRCALGAAALVALLVQVPGRRVLDGWPPPGWLVVACDVGQGDGLVLDAGPGAAVVVDTGPDPVRMDDCLRSLHIRRVMVLVLTHFHLDHVGGIDGVLRGRTVDQVLAGPLPEPVAGLQDVRHAIGSRTIRTPTVGTAVDAGPVHLDVLGPPVVLHDTRSDPNNDSLVLRATLGGVRILLPGDAEIEGQADVLDTHTDLRADVLKVAHHGSAYFDPAFYAAVHARVALISVGAGNSYGHPAPRTVDALQGLGMTVARTDRSGAIAIAGRRDALRLVTHRAAVAGGSFGPTDRTATVGPWTSRAAPAVSLRFATMNPCPPAPSPPTTSRFHCPGSSWSPARRNCWSPARSARSPPAPAGPIPTPSRPNWPAATSTAPRCTNSWARPCSVMPGWSWSPRPRTSAPRRWTACCPIWIPPPTARSWC